MKRTAIVGAVITLLTFLGAPAYAQVITTPYWCGSYWSSTPCNSGAYGNSYQYQYSQYPQYQYQMYPGTNYSYQNSYYPNNYNYNGNYPHGGYGNQYYYPPPTCSITNSYTNNPNNNYWNGGMYSQAIQLSWSSSYATSAYVTGIGATSPSGTRLVYPYGYTQYTMTVYGPGGSNTCTTYYQPPRYYQPPQPYYWQQMGYNYGNYYGY